MIENPKIVFLESNTTGTGELLIHKAISKGFQPVFITREPTKYSFIPIQGAELVTLDSNNKELLHDYLSQMKNLSGIYSSSEQYIEMASWLANKLELPGTDYEVVKLCRNKYALYQTLVGSNIDVPKTIKINHIDEAGAVLDELVFPTIIKPTTGTGSAGVKLCQNKIDCLEHITILFRNSYSDVLVQEYIDSPEFSVEVCSVSGNHRVIGITKKYTTHPPYFIETGHDFPAVLSAKDKIQIINSITRLLTTIKFNFGFSHIEVKVKNGRVFIIEVNPRLAGGMIPVLVEQATGLDLLDYLIDLYTKQNKDLKLFVHKFASIRHFIPQDSGKITQIGFENTVAIDQFKLIKQPGDAFFPQNDFRDRVAYLIVSDVEYDRCKERANQALQNFTITFES